MVIIYGVENWWLPEIKALRDNAMLMLLFFMAAACVSSWAQAVVVVGLTAGNMDGSLASDEEEANRRGAMAGAWPALAGRRCKSRR